MLLVTPESLGGRGIGKFLEESKIQQGRGTTNICWKRHPPRGSDRTIILKTFRNFTVKKQRITLLFFGLAVSSKAEEKTYTIQEFGHSVSQVPTKIGNHITNEIEDIKVYQKKNWAEGKAQFAKNIATIKSWFVKN